MKATIDLPAPLVLEPGEQLCVSTHVGGKPSPESSLGWIVLVNTEAERKYITSIDVMLGEVR